MQKGFNTAKRHYAFRILFIVFIVVLIGIIGGGWWLVVSTQPQATPFESKDFDVVANNVVETDTFSEQPSRPSKLEGATETIDDKGIVHGNTPSGINYVVYGRGETTTDPERITFAAVGDSLGTDNSMPIADAQAGVLGDGLFDFRPFYQEVGPVIRNYDLRFINQETVMAGTDDGRAYSGYPIFNSPDAMAEAIAAEEFNIVNFGSNHTWDMGEAGILRSHEVFDRWPNMMVVGSYLSPEDRSTVRLIERNGTNLAFLSYLYGDNHYPTASDFPNTYYSCPFDKDAMTDDIKRAQEVADAVIVYMHWGSEYTVEPNEQQRDYAQFLADLEVDLVIGSHAHIMQPACYVTGKNGNTVPVIYGLGDFLSGWTLTDTILSGLFTCDFVWHDTTLEVENLMWHPLIEWSDGGPTYIRLLATMDDATLDANTRTEDVSNDSVYLPAMINSAGMEIPVNMGR